MVNKSARDETSCLFNLVVESHYLGLVTNNGNVTMLELMIMVGRLVMRPPILQLTIFVFMFNYGYC
jgi:hypothetical protein